MKTPTHLETLRTALNRGHVLPRSFIAEGVEGAIAEAKSQKLTTVAFMLLVPIAFTVAFFLGYYVSQKADDSLACTRVMSPDEFCVIQKSEPVWYGLQKLING